MNFKPVNIEQIKKDVMEMSNEDIIKEYKISCYIGRTSPRGFKENGYLFTNGDYIRILVAELKERNLQPTSLRN